jgi:hypothetical protein
MSAGRGGPEPVCSALAALADLRAELESKADLEARRRAQLLAEVDEIEALLRSADRAAPAPATAERLEQLALEFEASHPEAAALLSRVSNLLASMGI